ncbi:2OG-Fe(II) oxygenase [Flavobacterium sp. TP390]|uniref:2OG-Fe(II) oxygenase n=1 Tax=Flavobacterium profundi TaxID=1774945 RepID=A0A6I4IV85_9FLAO|nr:2OG-Fe(II) oxygenase [Flavobacterium profundi]MVO10827.1 2OG-Fe(II) oxygenase [Flavobacterium profundi]
MKRNDIAEIIFANIFKNKDSLQKQYSNSQNEIGYFFIDALLPDEIVTQLNTCFPKTEEMVLKKSLRENKYIGVQMNKYAPILEEVLFAFQDEKVVSIIEEIVGLKEIYPDDKLYAGGISLMKKNQFLNPHLDNSHDKERERWRVFNLLYYISADWEFENGGNLELWPNGLEAKPITIESKCNRLVVMATHNNSLHSVSPVVKEVERKCISNYYFSDKPLKENDFFHVTSFRGRPENKIIDVLLQADSFLRMNIRKIFKKGIKENPHYYKKE